MEEIVLSAQPREVIGKQVRALRRQGKLPAVIYGRRVAPISISLDFREATRVLPRLSSSQLITIEVDGAPHTSLVREKQRNPINGALIHVDFLEVSMTETLHTTVRLELVGESPAVKELHGILVWTQEKLEIECLPGDLPAKIEVSIAVLKSIGDTIHVRDIVLPPNVEVLASPDEMIAVITPPLSDAKVTEAEGGVAEPEVIERGKKEEEKF